MHISEADYNEVLKIRQTVMYPEKDIDYVKLEEDENGIHLGVFLESELVSVVSIFLDANKNLQFRKLATIEKEQGKSYASQLIKWLMDYARDMKLPRIWCNSRVEAKGFYERLDMVATDEIFTRDGRNYVIMEKCFKYEEA